VDVTGGMAAKVQLMLEVVTAYPQIQAHIFSGEEPGNIYSMLTGASLGTRIQS
jgi:Predicted archaeal kinase